MQNKVLAKSFLWMFVGLLITFATGYFVSTNETMVYNVLGTGLYWIFAVIEIILVIVLSARIQKMKASTAKCLFILYSVVSGLTFSSIFLVYKLFSIFYVFIISAIIFLIFGLIGYFTKLDLSKISTYLFMMLIGVVICSIVNAFVQSESFSLGLTIVSLIVFIGYIAYDVQKAKRLSETVDAEALPIIIALDLYIDFINVFINLLRLLGENKD
ncbi:MAG: Bax inhibitor-1/YccA family protein [Bacilli bacterium]|nr:Bax inhibitor-1/YccA family protein [Bacilli bacterium]